MLKRIVVLVSGGGTNLQALIDAQARGELGGGQIVRVISSKEGVYALERARLAGIPGEVVARKAYPDGQAFDVALLEALEGAEPDLIVLAGFLCVLGKAIIQRYPQQIINVHPSLIPSFCGNGFYGLRVHQAALDYGVKVTGATVHFVNEITDGGKIILQKAVGIDAGDTPESLQKKVMEQAEWKILPEAVRLFCEGKLDLERSR